MRFDPFVWDEIETVTDHVGPDGRLRLKLSAPGALYVESAGFTALVGYAAEFDVQLQVDYRFRVEGKDLRAFIFNPVPATFACEGETFTNIDRRPTESGTLQEINGRLRLFELQQREILRNVRFERAELRRETEALAADQARNEPENVEPAQNEPVAPKLPVGKAADASGDSGSGAAGSRTSKSVDGV